MPHPVRTARHHGAPARTPQHQEFPGRLRFPRQEHSDKLVDEPRGGFACEHRYTRRLQLGWNGMNLKKHPFGSLVGRVGANSARDCTKGGPRLAPHLCDPPASQLALFSRTKRCPWYDPRRIQDRTFFQRLATIPTPLHEMFLVLQSRRWTLFQVSA